MELVNIVPIHNLQVIDSQPIKMFLTHLALKDDFYKRYARETSGYKILDNSLIEMGAAMNISTVLDVAEEIGADEVILQDVFQKGPETIKAVEKSLNIIHKRYGYNNCPFALMAVAQGRNEAEWVECYNTLEAMPEISCIGIPKVTAKMSPQGRPGFEHYWRHSIKEIHLLGLWYSFTELTAYEHPEKIRSCDSCQLAFLAKHHLRPEATRPDGFTVDLVNDYITTKEYTDVAEAYYKYMSRVPRGPDR